MPLGSTEKQKIMNHLQGRNMYCPICNSKSWTIMDDLMTPITIDLEYKRPIEGKYFPLVLVLCNDCGYVLQIAAGKAGLLS